MRNWPHAPSRNFSGTGSYIVTAATYHKEKLFNSAAKLDLLHDLMLDSFEEFGWEPKAWAIFPNYYHFVAFQESSEISLMKMVKKIHGKSAIDLNKLDGTPGRMVWYCSWPTKLTFERSYYARLAYVLKNPVHHGIVKMASDYKWCSAAWFERNADPTFYRTIQSFPCDNIEIGDDY